MPEGLSATTLGTAATPSAAAAETANEDDSDAVANAPEEKLVEADLLIEDVSIDGMCGVY